MENGRLNRRGFLVEAAGTALGVTAIGAALAGCAEGASGGGTASPRTGSTPPPRGANPRASGRGGTPTSTTERGQSGSSPAGAPSGTGLNIALQNSAVPRGELPSGWTNNMVAIGGGWMGWSNRDSAQQLLSMPADEVRQTLGRHKQKLLELREAGITRFMPDLEGEVSPAKFHEHDPARVVDAMRRRYDAVREIIGEKSEIFAYLYVTRWRAYEGGDLAPEQKTRHNACLALAERGAFDGIDGLCAVCYPAREETDRDWDAHAEFMRDSADLLGEVVKAAAARPGGKALERHALVTHGVRAPKGARPLLSCDAYRQYSRAAKDAFGDGKVTHWAGNWEELKPFLARCG